MFCSHGYVGTTFDGFAAIICRIHAATVAGFTTDCDNALQSRKRERNNYLPWKKRVNLTLSLIELLNYDSQKEVFGAIVLSLIFIQFCEKSVKMD